MVPETLGNVVLEHPHGRQGQRLTPPYAPLRGVSSERKMRPASPAKAGISVQEGSACLDETPAFAGVTACGARQNGLTITSTTMIATATPGTSFMILSPRPLTGRMPFSSFLP